MDHDAVPPRRQHRTMAAPRLLGLLQPQQQTPLLQRRHERQQRLAKAGQRRPQPIVRPLQAMFTQNRRAPRPESGPPTAARHVPKAPAWPHPHRYPDAPTTLEARFAVLGVQVVERTQGDRAKAAGDAGRCLLVDAIRLLAIADLSWHLTPIVAFQAVRLMFDDAPADSWVASCRLFSSSMKRCAVTGPSRKRSTISSRHLRRASAGSSTAAGTALVAATGRW